MPATASSPRRQSAKAPTPGSTTRSARATASGSLVTTIGCVERRLARGALERLGGRVQIAGAVIDDGDGHRGAPGSREQADDVRMTGVGRRSSGGAARRRRRRQRRASPRTQASKKRRSADSTSSPTTMPTFVQPRRPSVKRRKRRRLEADQQRQQEADGEHHGRRRAEQVDADLQRGRDHDIAEQHQPQPVPQHPQRRQQERPEREAVAHEDEALRIGRRPRSPSAAARARCRWPWLTCFLSHALRPAVNALIRRACPWSTGSRSPRARSIATAARSARASPLKQDSAI